MAKKPQKPKKLVEEVEPFDPEPRPGELGLSKEQGETHPPESDRHASEQAAEDSSAGVQESAETGDSTWDQDQVETPASDSPAPEEESAEKDLLADVRSSLIEEESLEKEKPPRWWRKMGKGRKKDKAIQALPEEEINLAAAETPTAMINEQQNGKESEDYGEQLDELISLLEPSTEEASSVPTVDEEVSISPDSEQPVPKVDIEEQKKQAFQPRLAAQQAENISEVRSVALEGEEEVFVEVESKREDPFDERLKAIENALQPYRKYLNLTLVFLGVVMAVTAGLLLYTIYQQMAPPPTPVAVSNLPYPTSVSLPGGWSFDLGRGRLQEGRWNPQGAEWLEGTEVCRWVALPWSRQLEAVIRTLNPNDPIELTMSNNDRFVYSVYTIEQLTQDEMLDLDSNSPCLLLVLAEADSDSRWVLTALP
jgi:hypothetical protein